MAAPPSFIQPTHKFDRRSFGKYDILCRLSTGGMSQIFLAYQKGLAGFRKIVVLKSILPDISGEEDFVSMFLDEAKTTASFQHPNIAQVYDLDVDQEMLFLAMEFVQGCTLVEMARACRMAKEPIPIGFTLSSVRDTALALHYAHNYVDEQGHKTVVIHRDVAEKNIMVTYEGTTKLLDFGIAKAAGRNTRTTVGMVKGTSGYMSPEQIRGEELDPRSDIFSLGVVAHECLTGMRLFHGKNPEEGMLAALRDDVAPPSKQNPAVTAAVDAVVLKALARDREKRFATALEFARALEKAAYETMWHPEQSGELVARHFADRRKQTRDLLAQAQAALNASGEIKLDTVLDRLSMSRPSQPDMPRRTSTESAPQVSASTAPIPPRKEGKGGAGFGASGGAPERTDSVTGKPQAKPGPRPSVPPAGAINVTNAESFKDFDDDDVGGKTIPATMLPNGEFVLPPEPKTQRDRPGNRPSNRNLAETKPESPVAIPKGARTTSPGAQPPSDSGIQTKIADPRDVGGRREPVTGGRTDPQAQLSEPVTRSEVFYRGKGRTVMISAVVGIALVLGAGWAIRKSGTKPTAEEVPPARPADPAPHPPPVKGEPKAAVVETKPAVVTPTEPTKPPEKPAEKAPEKPAEPEVVKKVEAPPPPPSPKKPEPTPEVKTPAPKAEPVVKREPPRPAPVKAPVKKAESSGDIEEVNATISSSPGGLSVMLDGKINLGKTPLKISIPAGPDHKLSVVNPKTGKPESKVVGKQSSFTFDFEED